jgi:hypothetical protein
MSGYTIPIPKYIRYLTNLILKLICVLDVPIMGQIVTRLWARWPRNRSIPGWGKRCLSFPNDQTGSARHTPVLPIQCISEACSPGHSDQAVNPTTHFCLVSGLRMSGAVSPHPHTSSIGVKNEWSCLHIHTRLVSGLRMSGAVSISTHV